MLFKILALVAAPPIIVGGVTYAISRNPVSSVAAVVIAVIIEVAAIAWLGNAFKGFD